MNSVASLVFLWRTYERVLGSDSFTVAIICFAAASNSASLPGCTFSLAITVIGIVDLLQVSNSSTVVSTCARFFKAQKSLERTGQIEERAERAITETGTGFA